MNSPFFGLIVFFLVLSFLCLLVYVLVVRAYYWGGRKGPPVKQKRTKQADPGE